MKHVLGITMKRNHISTDLLDFLCHLLGKYSLSNFQCDHRKQNRPYSNFAFMRIDRFVYSFRVYLYSYVYSYTVLHLNSFSRTSI